MNLIFQKDSSYKRSLSDYILMGVLLLFLVSPFFKFYKFPQALVIILFLIRIYNQKGVNTFFKPVILKLFLIYSALALIQGVIWGFSIISFLSSFTFGFILPYLIIINYGFSFFELLEKVLYPLTVLALIFWLGLNFNESIRAGLISLIDSLHPYSSDSTISDNMKRSIVFYTYIYDQKPMSNGLYRNSGFAHEPGAFSLFLCFGVYLNYLKGKGLFSWRMVIYVIAIITTFSTAGYIAFFTLGLIFLLESKRRVLGILILPLVLYFTYNFYINSEFLGEKIENQVQDQTSRRLDRTTTGRLYGARKSLYVLQKYPLHGRGLLAMTKPALSSHPEYAAYGWLSEISRFGVLAGALGLLLFIKGFVRFSRLYSARNFAVVLGLISLFINLTSQVFLTNPLIFVFFYIGLLNFRQNHE